MNRFWGLLHRAEDFILVFVLLSMILLAGGDILVRWLFGGGISWIPPLLRVMVLWLGLLGALVATRTREHITVDLINRLAPKKVTLVLNTISHLFAAIICFIIAYHSQLFVQMAREFDDIAFNQVPAWITQIIIPFAFAGMGLRFLGHVRQTIIPSKIKECSS